jgi:hypothetical protein
MSAVILKELDGYRMQAMNVHATTALLPETAFQACAPFNVAFPCVLRDILQARCQLPRTPLPLSASSAITSASLSDLQRSELSQLLQTSCPSASPAFAKMDPMKTWSLTPQASEHLAQGMQVSPLAPETPVPAGNSWSERLCHTTFFGQCPYHKSNKYRRCEVCPSAQC